MHLHNFTATYSFRPPHRHQKRPETRRKALVSSTGTHWIPLKIPSFNALRRAYHLPFSPPSGEKGKLDRSRTLSHALQSTILLQKMWQSLSQPTTLLPPVLHSCAREQLSTEDRILRQPHHIPRFCPVEHLIETSFLARRHRPDETVTVTQRTPQRP